MQAMSGLKKPLYAIEIPLFHNFQVTISPHFGLDFRASEVNFLKTLNKYQLINTLEE